MKKLLGIVLSAAMLLSMAACGSTAASSAASSAAADSTADAATATDAAASDLKVGVITIGDETEGYTAAHINGIKAAAQKLGMSDSQIVLSALTLQKTWLARAATLLFPTLTATRPIS